MTVDHIVGEEHRNLQPALHDSRMLQRTVLRLRDGVERAAHAACRDLLDELRLRHLGPDADQAELADLLVERHPADQIGDERLLVGLAGGLDVRRVG